MHEPRWFLFPARLALALAALVWLAKATVQAAAPPKTAEPAGNSISNGDFQVGEVGGLPQGWKVVAAHVSLIDEKN